MTAMKPKVARNLDQEKRVGQMRSRADVVLGLKSMDDNFLVPREIARKFTYKFKA